MRKATARDLALEGAYSAALRPGRWVLVRGQDYTAGDDSARNYLYRLARSKGIKIRIRKHAEGLAVEVGK